MRRVSGRWRHFWGTRSSDVRAELSIVGRRRLLGAPGSRARRSASEPRHQRLEREPKPPFVLPPRTEFPLALVADDGVGDEVRAHARHVLERVAESTHRPVVAGRIVLRLLRDPALDRPAVVKAMLQVGKRVARVNVAAETPAEAIDLAERRLRRSLERLEELDRDRRHRRGRRPRPDLDGGVAGRGATPPFQRAPARADAPPPSMAP